jgi:hypothetical protein
LHYRMLSWMYLAVSACTIECCHGCISQSVLALSNAVMGAVHSASAVMAVAHKITVSNIALQNRHVRYTMAQQIIND